MPGRYSRTVLRILPTLAIVAGAIWAGRIFWAHYMENPWTRDGRVRAKIVNVSADVPGIIVELAVRDNQAVRKGDLLFAIDPARYKLLVDAAEAAVAARRDELEQRRRELSRRRPLASATAVSKEELEQVGHAVLLAESAHKEAVAALGAARLNLARTRVLSPANGYVTNLQAESGEYANTGTPILALVNADSFHVCGYFEETKLRHIREGAPATVRLMGYDNDITGRVESIAPAIADRENSTAPDLVANVNPTFSWVRLAQRIPVRITLDTLPEGIHLRAGMTATIIVEPSPKTDAAGGGTARAPTPPPRR
jgi:RND family efflux transporter MFP subunit